jgi:integrase
VQGAQLPTVTTIPVRDRLVGHVEGGAGLCRASFSDGRDHLVSLFGARDRSHEALDEHGQQCAYEQDPPLTIVAFVASLLLPIAGVARDLRDTAASLAVQAGANVKVLQRMLVHAEASMTLDVYADLSDSDLDDVVAALAPGARASGIAGLPEP